MSRRPGSLATAINWMGRLTLLLFWMPVLGPLIAGLAGGGKARVRAGPGGPYLPSRRRGDFIQAYRLIPFSPFTRL